MKTIFITGMATVFLSLMIIVACAPSTTSSTGTPAQTSTAAPKKEPVLYTGKSCLSQMAGMAARWQPDALPFHMESGLNAESNGHDGKSSVWHAMFASPSRHLYRVVYLLDWDGKNKQLLWVVVYGVSSKEAKGRGVIDATTGKFLRAG